MRVVRRVAERLVDATLELFREGVLQAPSSATFSPFGVSVMPRYGSWAASLSAASFFTIALADAGETPCRFASAVTETGLLSVPSL